MFFVSDVLGVGEEKAVTGKELCKSLGIEQRAFHAMIEEERRSGKPICACYATEKAGYYLASNKQEMQTYCNTLQKRKNSIQKTLKACKNTINYLPDAKRRKKE